jgi:calcineurin-like phosphoesterase family protein
MPTTYITSDLHFGHKSILKYRNKFNYQTVDEMTDGMIAEWNETVESEESLTYILGDFSFYTLSKTVEILEQLRGYKLLVAGNHDQKLRKCKSFKDQFVDIVDYHTFKYGQGHNQIRVVMMHFPIMDWHGMRDGSLHFHGHTHGHKTGLEHLRTMDVGMDVTGKVLIDFDEAVEKVRHNQISYHNCCSTFDP